MELWLDIISNNFYPSRAYRKSGTPSPSPRGTKVSALQKCEWSRPVHTTREEKKVSQEEFWTLWKNVNSVPIFFCVRHKRQ